MRILCSMAIAVILAFTSVPSGWAAEEELFDSKTAAEHLEKGLAHLKAKKYASAVEELEESLAYAPDAEAYYYLGYAYYLIGRTGDAESRKKSIECFDKAYELNPGFRPTRYRTEDMQQPTQQKAPSPQAETGTDPGQQAAPSPEKP